MLFLTSHCMLHVWGKVLGWDLYSRPFAEGFTSARFVLPHYDELPRPALWDSWALRTNFSGFFADFFWVLIVVILSHLAHFVRTTSSSKVTRRTSHCICAVRCMPTLHSIAHSHAHNQARVLISLAMHISWTKDFTAKQKMTPGDDLDSKAIVKIASALLCDTCHWILHILRH